MYENLIVKNHKALKHAELTELGSVNIICGRNNSGKSTLLEAIEFGNTRNPGRMFSEKEIKNIAKESQKKYGYNSDQIFIKQYHKLVEDAFASSEIWFLGDSGKLVGFFNEQWKIRLAGYGLNSSYIVSEFNKYFNNSLSTILLPPKRNLDITIILDNLQEVLPTGSGVINSLFHAKNQPENSKESDFYNSLSTAFMEITSGHKFEIFMGAGNYINVSFSKDKTTWVKAQDSGLGLQEVLIILFFSLNDKYKIILIEEPEVHVHPEMQRKLLYFLKNETKKQFFITTHSNIFLDTSLIDRVFLCKCDSNIEIDDTTNKALILDELGFSVSENLVSDLIILTEGPSDIPFIKEFLMKFEWSKEFNIKLWPIGGDIMKKSEIDLSVFTQSHSLIALIDNDPGSVKARKAFVKKCDKHGVYVKHLERYAIENYFTLEAIIKILNCNIPAGLQKIEPDKKLSNQIGGVCVKKNNGRIGRAMSIEDIEGTDLYSFFENVKSRCESARKNKLS